MANAPTRAPRHIHYISVALVSAAVSTACSMGDEPEPKVAPAKPAETPPPAPPPAPSAETRAPSPREDPAADVDPSGFHLDDPDVEYEVPRRPSRGRKGRPIEIVLRSSPPGAVAAVDGVTIGPTPSLWEGAADSTAREFTFVLPGYAIARYRFVPTRSGTVHATLEPIKLDAKEDARRKLAPPRETTPAPAAVR